MDQATGIGELGMGQRRVEVVADKGAIATRAMTLVVERIEAVLSRKQFCSVVLSGGSTPKPLYAALAERSLPWDRLLIFWGDERYVPSDHPDSNEKMAREAWLDRVPIPADQVFAMPTGAGDPAIDAAIAELEKTRKLKKTLPAESSKQPKK